MTVQYFANLDVWQRSRRLVTTVYGITRGLPRSEGANLTLQLRRAVVSIPSNIAEGAGRSGRRDFARFLDIAIGSTSEVESHLVLCRDLDLIAVERCEMAQVECIEIRSMLRGLRRAVLAGSSDS